MDLTRVVGLARVTRTGSRAPDLGSALQLDGLDWRLTVVLSLFILAIFGTRDVLILLRSDWPHLDAVVGVPSLYWEEIVAYLPLARAFSAGNLLPIAPAMTGYQSGLSPLPPLAIVLQGVLFRTAGLGNNDIFLLVGHSLLPVLNFWVIYLIFRRFVRKSWALLFAFWGIGYYSDFSSLGYVSRLLFAPGSAWELASLNPPEISRVPFPGLSLLFFSCVFYLTVKSNRLSLRRVAVLSGLWGLQVYVYPLNFVAGVAFFLPWVVYAHRITSGAWSPRRLSVSLAIAVLMTAAVSGMYLLMHVLEPSDLGREFMARLRWSEREAGLYFGNWNLLVSYGLPAAFLGVVVWLWRSDYYELFYKFTPVLIAVVVDLALGSVNVVTGRMLAPELYYHRISGMLFRFFYFIPLIYYLGQPYKSAMSRRGRRFSRWAMWVHGVLQKAVIGWRVAIAGAGMVGIGAIIVLGGVRSFREYESAAAVAMRQVEEELQVAREAGVYEGLVAYETLEANLLAPARSADGTLLVNSYGNYVSEAVILERLVLYGKLLGWSEDDFRAFMLPTAEAEELASYRERVVSRSLMERGLGYWLLNHRKRMSQEEIVRYREDLEEAYRSFDVREGLARSGLRAVVARRPVAEGFAGGRVVRRGGYYVTLFGG